MRLPSIYPKYIQKSKLFLYPILRIRRGVSVTPVQTYITWEDKYNLHDYKFIVLYHLRDDKDFKQFEEQKLLNNPLFETFHELEGELGAYVFDFSQYKEAVKKIINGKYSLLTNGYKRTLLGFFKNHHKHHAYLESYLYPEEYVENYASILAEPKDIDSMESLLRNVGELCSLPNLESERLEVKEKIIIFDSIIKPI